MIVREERALSGPIFYAACLACGWCSRPTVREEIASAADDAHLVAKLAARRPRRCECEIPRGFWVCTACQRMIDHRR